MVDTNTSASEELSISFIHENVINHSDRQWISATKREKSFWTTLLFTPPSLRSRQQKKHALSYSKRRGTYALSAWRLI